MSLSTMLITIATLGLGISILPEIYKVYKNPENVLSFSPTFLIMKIISSLILLVGLILTKDRGLVLVIIINIWYTFYYSYLLKKYYYVRNKKD